MLTTCMALIDEPSDKAKFLEIYYTYKDIMYDASLSILKNKALAEEVVQDSFFKIAKKITDIAEINSTKTASFIIVITKNSAIDRLRKEHIDETVPLNEEMQDISEDILSKTIIKEGRNYLMSVVNELEDIYSSVLMLKYAFEYDNETIAHILKIPKRTVETRIYRGKKILQEKLEDYYGKLEINK